jgi:hypothetical protein
VSAFYCREGKHWVDRPKGWTMTETKRKHAEEHVRERSVFSTLDLMELDVQLDAYYGGQP